MKDDPFAPLPPAELMASIVGAARSADADIVIPAPLPLPQRDRIRHSRHGAPSAVWSYRAGWVAPVRDMPVRPRGRQGGSSLLLTAAGWIWKAPPIPRPLYGLDKSDSSP